MILGDIPFIGQVQRVEHFTRLTAEFLNLSESSGAVPPPGDGPHLAHFQCSRQELMDVSKFNHRATSESLKNKPCGFLRECINFS
jgi:hypothetical protein